MKKQLFAPLRSLALAGLLLSGVLSAQAAGLHRLPPHVQGYKLTGTSATIPVTDIREIKAGHAWRIILTQGNTPSVRLEYDASIAGKLEAGTSRGTLYLSGQNRSGNGKHIAYITVSNLQELELSGASEAEGKNTIVSRGNFDLDLSGASEAKNLKVRTRDFSADLSGASELSLMLTATGEVDLDLSGASEATVTSGQKVREMSIDLSGASELQVKGFAQKAEVDLSGASELHGQDLAAQQAEIEASGASEITMTVRGTVELEASGASLVTISGKPTIRSNRSDRSSRVVVK